jgi:myo-inositol-1(or 4)-monophosphatase
VKLAAQCAEVTENGDCYAYGMLARGLRDVVVDAGLKPYDILALVPIIEGAGGKITAWNGAPITLMHFSTALAVGDAALADAVTSLLSS